MAALAFTKRDVQRAIAGAREGGMVIGRAEIDPRTGRIVILSATETSAQGDALDEELRAWRDKNGDG